MPTPHRAPRQGGRARDAALAERAAADRIRAATSEALFRALIAGRHDMHDVANEIHQLYTAHYHLTPRADTARCPVHPDTAPGPHGRPICGPKENL
jgi:hypothetical protein